MALGDFHSRRLRRETVQAGKKLLKPPQDPEVTKKLNSLQKLLDWKKNKKIEGIENQIKSIDLQKLSADERKRRESLESQKQVLAEEQAVERLKADEKAALSERLKPLYDWKNNKKIVNLRNRILELENEVRKTLEEEIGPIYVTNIKYFRADLELGVGFFIGTDNRIEFDDVLGFYVVRD